MAWEEITAFWEKLETDAKAQELLGNLGQPQNEEEELAAIVNIAKELGYDLTAEDIKAYEEARREKTDEQADKIRQLADAEVEQVAGGGTWCAGNQYRQPCKYSYKDYENCWIKDGCDLVNQHYEWYRCHYNTYSDCDAHDQRC